MNKIYCIKCEVYKKIKQSIFCTFGTKQYYLLLPVFCMVVLMSKYKQNKIQLINKRLLVKWVMCKMTSKYCLKFSKYTEQILS